MISKTLLYYNTLRNLSPTQIFGRVYAIIKRKYKLYKLPQIPKELSGKLNPKMPFLERDPRNNAEEIKKGKFNFSNQLNDLGYPINWDNGKMSSACKLHIHFFNFLYLLDDDMKKEICYSWIDNNAVGHPISWHPYALSLRIFSWMRANLNDEKIDNSIFQQAAYLYRNNEFYIPANHYLENGKALLIAGIYFNQQDESKKWFDKGLAILSNAIDSQFSKDGFYYEQSLSYHLITAQIYLDVLNIIPENNSYYKSFLLIITKMADVLVSSLHPDNHTAQFSDSTFEVGNNPIKVLNNIFQITGYKPKKRFYFEESGLCFFKNEKIYFALDAGKLADPKMSGHAHADIFTYEISYLGKRLIVDTGVGTYTAGAERLLMRSTRAHNTLCIDGVNQAELWSSFRTGKIYNPENVKYYSTENSFSFKGTFTGYKKIIGDELVHNREMSFEKNVLKVEDSVAGKNKHLFESMIHLHPDAIIVDQNDKEVKINFHEELLVIRILNGNIKIEETNYYPEIGLELPNKTLVIYKNDIPPISLTYQISFLSNKNINII